MKTTALLTTLMLALPAAMAIGSEPIEVRSPTCDLPDLPPILCVEIILGDIFVGHGETQQFNDGQYVVHGDVTVEEGGTLEIIDASVNFTGGSDEPITIMSGGTLVIDDSEISSFSNGAAIIVEDGATATITGSDFAMVGIHVSTDTAQIGSNRYRLSTTGLTLVNYDGTVAGESFTNVTEGIIVNGGCPILQDIAMAGIEFGIMLRDTCATLERIDMADVGDTGVQATNSQGTYSNMAIADRWEPGTEGFDIVDTSGQTTLSTIDASQFGTGLFTCNANVVYNAADFTNNLVPTDTC